MVPIFLKPLISLIFATFADFANIPDILDIPDNPDISDFPDISVIADIPDSPQMYIPDTLFWKNHKKNSLFLKISHNLGAFFFLEKRTQNQAYYCNFEFFRLFLHDVHNLEKFNIYQDFISDTLFWKIIKKTHFFGK